MVTLVLLSCAVAVIIAQAFIAAVRTAKESERERCLTIVGSTPTRDFGATQRIREAIASGRPPKAPRKAFDVTDDEDAPDGAELNLPERGGWFRRVGDTWYPIDPPEVALTEEHITEPQPRPVTRCATTGARAPHEDCDCTACRPWTY